MRKGFTLIELLIVIAIAGLLSAVIVGAVRGSRDRNTEEARPPEKASAPKSDGRKGKSTTFTITDGDTFEVGDTDFDPGDVELSMEQECGEGTDPSDRAECEKEYRRQQNIRSCVDRYSRQDY